MINYVPYLYIHYIVGAYHNYPEEVAKKLRRAVYYTNTDLKPQEAIKYYKQALQVAEELEMDPFSDEVMGIKIQVAALMERIGAQAKAAQVLEILRNDCMAWMQQLGGKESNRKKRTRVLRKLVAMTVKLGELYASPEVYDRDLAQQRLIWAVETMLKETQRRGNLQEARHLSQGELDDLEGPWMPQEEIGAGMEALAHSYEEKGQHYLAAPLFLRALSLYPKKDCHMVILMNNLATALGQQSPKAAQAVAAATNANAITDPAAASAPAPTRESLVQNAQAWSQKALEIAAAIAPPERTEECDVGCAVATHNLGEFAEMTGLKDEARKRYGEAMGLARAIGFAEGVEMSGERLRALGS